MRKKQLEQQINALLSKCENLAADLASAKDVAAHYKREADRLKYQLEQAAELVTDLTAQLELAKQQAEQPAAQTAEQPVPEPDCPSAVPQAVAAPAEEIADTDLQRVQNTASQAPQRVTAPHITAGATPQMDFGAKAIGDAVFACTKFCNGATGELQRDLVHLALGKTEVFKGTVLAIIEGEGTEAQKQQEITKALAEVLEYFEGLKQQEV